jgi:hypothetical protein
MSGDKLIQRSEEHPFSKRNARYINHFQGLNVNERRSTSIKIKESPRDNMSISLIKSAWRQGKMD